MDRWTEKEELLERMKTDWDGEIKKGKQHYIAGKGSLLLYHGVAFIPHSSYYQCIAHFILYSNL